MKVVLIFSGGMDSTVLLYQLRAQGHEVFCLSVDYGQRHRKELAAAQDICGALGVEHRLADLSAIAPLLSGNSLISDEIEVPDGHYAEENMKATVVPNRNMIMLSVAIGWAVSSGCESVAYGAHGGDHAIYPDCRREFIEAMALAAGLCDWSKIELLAPLQEMDKTGIARLGAELDVPFVKTWSCYKGGDIHCGTCGTCTERKEAFRLAQIEDPTTYMA